jgi:hypothetical protein
MLKLLLNLFAPGEKLPAESSKYSFGYDGLSFGWAFFILVAAVLGVVWSYRKFSPSLGHVTRGGLIFLRCLLVALVLILLVRPFLMISVEESVRRPLLVLLDLTQSMQLVDPRTGDDLARAALAKGDIEPAGGLAQTLPGNGDDLKKLSRQQLLEAIAANPKLNLWARIADHADLHFYGFGRKLTDLGALAAPEGSKLTTDESAAFFHALHFDDNLTSLGDGLRDLLDQQRGQQTAGILLITDGSNNNGSPPVAAANIARQDGVPLFIYGVGVTSPKDIMVAELTGPQVSNVKEKVTMLVRVRAQSMLGKKGTVQLKANGKVVDEQPIEFRADGEQEISLSYTPDDLGDVQLEAYVPPLPEEAVKTNNSATAKVRIVDDKIRVLFVEQLPRWDFQYLLAMLQRDRRIKLQVVMLKGDPGLSSLPDSPFIDQIPSDKTALLANDVLILGDVDPKELGDDRMKIWNDWVSKVGGGLIFLAGEKFDPSAYGGTPLEPLLPVEIGTDPSPRYDTPVQLKLSPAGELSSLLALSDNPQENQKLWDAFPGVHWTARVGKVRPSAQALLVDPTAERANRDGPMPVIALQSYGLGQALYIGTDETYRWRSRQGEKYYTRLWGQMIQGLSAQRLMGASTRTQLKTDRPRYLTGDHVKITGRIFKPNFEPLTDAEVAGTFSIKSAPGENAPKTQTTELRLQSIPDRPGEYHGEFVAQTAGSYSFSTVQDPAAILKFDVEEPKVELADIAMNESLLRSMAQAAQGHFLREENLNGLPDLIATQSTGTVSYKKIPLVFAPALFGLILLIACAEWLWRRKLELK